MNWLDKLERKFGRYDTKSAAVYRYAVCDRSGT